MITKTLKARTLAPAVLGTVVALLLILPSLADAIPARHLRLLKSEPAADTTVAESPRELRLWFTQRPELAMTSARITSGSHNVAAGRAAIRPTDDEGVLVVMPVQATLPNGKHVVSWRTMAQDGHVITGEFAFTVAVRGSATGKLPLSSTAARPTQNSQ